MAVKSGRSPVQVRLAAVGSVVDLLGPSISASSMSCPAPGRRFGGSGRRDRAVMD